jgi:hypothetical protein
MDINRMMAEGKGYEIAAYCLRDVQATLALYRIWQQRLAAVK